MCSSAACSTGRELYSVSVRLHSASRTTQSESVENHRCRAEAHCQCSEHGGEQNTREGVQHAGCDRDAKRIVDKRESQILLHVGDGTIGKMSCGGDPTQVAFDQGYLSAVHGHIGTCTHGDANISF